MCVCVCVCAGGGGGGSLTVAQVSRLQIALQRKVTPAVTLRASLSGTAVPPKEGCGKPVLRVWLQCAQVNCYEALDGRRRRACPWFCRAVELQPFGAEPQHCLAASLVFLLFLTQL